MKSLVSRQCLLATGGLRDAQPDRPSDFPIVLYAQRQLFLAVGFSEDEQAHMGECESNTLFWSLAGPFRSFSYVKPSADVLTSFNGYSN